MHNMFLIKITFRQYTICVSLLVKYKQSREIPSQKNRDKYPLAWVIPHKITHHTEPLLFTRTLHLK